MQGWRTEEQRRQKELTERTRSAARTKSAGVQGELADHEYTVRLKRASNNHGRGYIKEQL